MVAEAEGLAKMPPNSRAPKRAARLAALLPLWRSGRLQLYTYAQIGRMVGMDRSTALRDIRDMELVNKLEPFFSHLFGGRVMRRRKINRN